MQNFAVIEKGKIVNVVLAEADYATEQGWVLIPEESFAGIGWDYVDGQFVDNRPKPEPLPEPAAPTKEELLTQLNALAAQIQSLG
jgi:hypothetical protein